VSFFIDDRTENDNRLLVIHGVEARGKAREITGTERARYEQIFLARHRGFKNGDYHRGRLELAPGRRSYRCWCALPSSLPFRTVIVRQLLCHKPKLVQRVVLECRRLSDDPSQAACAPVEMRGTGIGPATDVFPKRFL
jgi:hypothetical protein